MTSLKKILLSPSHFNGTEQEYLQELSTDTSDPVTDNNLFGFENDICEYTKAKACTALSSGTASIHLALILLGIKEKDEVICSSFTFSATVNPIRYLKATPILIDSEIETWNMSPILLRAAIEDRIRKGKKPKAIILVHLYGMPSKLDELMNIANNYEIPVIEDAAEAFGSFYKNKALGTFGELGVFSFNRNKIITTSGGGALISDRTKYCKNAVFLATQARDEAPHYQHSTIGYNYRLSTVLAGIGRSQIKLIDKRVKARRENFDYYSQELSTIKEITFLKEPENMFSNRWLTTILTKNFDEREKIRVALDKRNIESRPLWKPMHLQPVFKSFPQYIDQTSEELFNKGLCLPSGSNLTDEDKNRIVSAIKSLY